MTTIRSNLERAERALKCLQSEYNDNDLETDLSDLVCDLQHLADHAGLEWQDIILRANGHYEAEIEEEINWFNDHPIKK